MATPTSSRSQTQDQSSSLYHVIQVSAPVVLRVTLGLVFLWLGITKFIDPQTIVGVFRNTYSFLADPTIVYILASLEVLTALWLFVGIGMRFLGILMILFFIGTLSIFAMLMFSGNAMFAKQGFPALNVTGEFFWKDICLIGVALMLIAQDMAKQAAKRNL